MICKKCRNNVKTDFKYCPYCGERVISDFHESYGELTPPFIIEDQGQDDEAAKFYVSDSAIEQPDFDRYSSAPPNARGDKTPDAAYESQSRGYEAPAGNKPVAESPSPYFVYPDDMTYGSLDSERKDAYDYVYDAPKVSEPRYDAPEVSEPRYDAHKVSEPRYDAPKVSEPRYDAPRASEPRYDAPKVSEPRYDAPRASEPRYDAPRASEPYYVYTGETRQDADRQDGHSEPKARGGAESRNMADDDLSFDAPDQCIQIDMSFAEPVDDTVGHSDLGAAVSEDDDAPYYVYRRDAAGERESVLPFDDELSQDLASARVRQSGSAIAAKLALILLITAVAIAASIFGYRYITGISDKDAWIIGDASSVASSSSVSEPSSSVSEPSSSVSELSSSVSEPSLSVSEPSSSVPGSSSAASNP